MHLLIDMLKISMIRKKKSHAGNLLVHVFLFLEISMNDNKKFSIREYREALYNDIIKKKKEQRKKLQAKYLEKLAHVNDFDRYDLEDKPSK